MKLCAICKNTYPDDYQTCPRDQSALTTPVTEIVPGVVIRGKYEIISELGAGGMATVYKAKHKAFHEVVALKVVHGQFMYDPDFVKRFRNEAIIVRQLKHPNAVHIEDFDYTEDGRPFIVMEFVDGRSLYDLRHAAPGPWPIDRCLDIICQAASALSAAHTIGIVHRDIKPSNILLLKGPNDELIVKVLDFGIAKVGENNTFAGMTAVQTQQNLVIGTPEYMSPEQASGHLDNSVDGRSDLYSLALVLYEMLTGIPPFQADTPIGMLMQQVNTLPAPPESVAGNIPQALSALVLKALQKDPAKRFQSAAEMITAMHDPVAWYANQPARSPVSAPAAEAAAPSAPASPPPSPAVPSLIPQEAQPMPVSWQPMPGQPQPMPSPTPRSGGSSRLPYVLLGIFLFVIALAGAGYYAVHALFNKAKTTITQASSSAVDPPAAAAPPRAVAETPASPGVTTDRAAIAAPVEPRAVLRAPGKPIAEKPVAAPPKESALTKATEAEKLYTEKNYAQAFPLADEACAGGIASGCFYVGRMYEKGLGVAQNYPEAAVVYRRACDGGVATSCINLGFMYEKGSGVAKDYPLAAILYQKACDGGVAAACANLGILYELGHGVTQNRSDALKFYRRGCEAGNQPACDSVRRVSQ